MASSSPAPKRAFSITIYTENEEPAHLRPFTNQEPNRERGAFQGRAIPKRAEIIIHGEKVPCTLITINAHSKYQGTIYAISPDALHPQYSIQGKITQGIDPARPSHLYDIKLIPKAIEEEPTPENNSQLLFADLAGIAS